MPKLTLAPAPCRPRPPPLLAVRSPPCLLRLPSLQVAVDACATESPALWRALQGHVVSLVSCSPGFLAARARADPPPISLLPFPPSPSQVKDTCASPSPAHPRASSEGFTKRLLPPVSRARSPRDRPPPPAVKGSPPPSPQPSASPCAARDASESLPRAELLVQRACSPARATRAGTRLVSLVAACLPRAAR